MEYEDFLIEFVADADGDGVTVRSGSSQGHFTPSPGWPVLVQRVDGQLRTPTSGGEVPDLNETHAKTLGTALFNAVFAGPIGAAWRSATAAADTTNQGVRLGLHFPKGEAASRLRRLPWEYLHDDQSFLVMNPRRAITRRIGRASARGPQEGSTLRILLMAASPAGLHPLNTKGELSAIRAALKPLEQEGRVEIEQVAGGTWSALLEKLGQPSGWHILHFVGHGGPGTLHFEDAIGGSDALSSQKIGAALQACSSLRLVFLNACKGGASGDGASVADALVHAGVPAVIAMQFAISDSAAADFSRAFYTGMAAGHTVEAAVALARVREYVKSTVRRPLEWGTPTLSLPSRSGRLFELGVRPSIAWLPDTVSPYRGLGALDEEHAQVFLGRDAEMSAVLDRIEARAPLSMVIAPSGGGKTSFVRSGLVARAKAKGWAVEQLAGPKIFMAVCRAVFKAKLLTPEQIGQLRDAPQRLVAALSDALVDDQRLVLIVDRFEDLMTASQSDGRRKFVELLLAAAELEHSGLAIVLGMQAERVGEFLRARGLGRLLSKAAIYLLPMGRSQLEQAIEMPALMAGYRFEPGLVDRLIEEVEDRPGALPLLAAMLAKLWEQRDPEFRLLRWAHYEDIGRLDGSIEAYAEGIFNSLSDPAGSVPDIFRRLVDVGLEIEDRKRWATRVELIGDMGRNAGAVLDTLVRRGLLATDPLFAGPDDHPSEALDSVVDEGLIANADRDQEPAYELAHQALLTQWGRLKGWINDDRADLGLRAQIEQAAVRWKNGSPDELWRGDKLQLAIALRDARRYPLNADAEAFLTQSREVIEDDRRLTVVEEMRATDPSSAALVLAGVVHPSHPRLSYLNELAATPGLITAKLAEDAHAMALGPNGRVHLLSLDGVSVWDAGFRSAIRTLRFEGPLDHQRAYLYKAPRLAVSPGGRVVAVGAYGDVFVWDAEDDQRTPALKLKGLRVLSAGPPRVVSLDGRGLPASAFEMLIAPSHARMALAVDADLVALCVGRFVSVMRLRGGPHYDFWVLEAAHRIKSISLGGGSRSLLAVLDSGTEVAVWRVADGTGEPHVLTVSGPDITVATISPDGRHLVVGQQGGEISVWQVDAVTGTFGSRPTWSHADSQAGPVQAFAFEPGGQMLVAASGNDVTWWTVTGLERRQSVGVDLEIEAVEFSPDGRYILARDRDHNVQVWRSSDPRTALLRTHSSRVFGFSPDGTSLILNRQREAGAEAQLEVVCLAPAESSFAHQPDWRAQELRISPYGGQIIVWRPQASELFVLQPDGRPHKLADLNAPIGDTVSFGADRSARVSHPHGFSVVELATGEVTRFEVPQGEAEKSPVGTISPDGRWVLNGDGNVTHRPAGSVVPRFLLGEVGSPADETVLREYAFYNRRHLGPGDIQSAFSPDGSVLIQRVGLGVAGVFRVTNDEIAHSHTVHFFPGSDESDLKFDRTGLGFSQDGRRFFIRTGAALFVFDARLPDDHEPQYEALEFDDDLFMHVALSPDGSQIAGSTGTEIRLWTVDDESSPKIVINWPDVHTLAFSPDGKCLLAAPRTGPVRVFWLDGHALQAKLDQHLNWCLSAEFLQAHLGMTETAARDHFRRRREYKGV